MVVSGERILDDATTTKQASLFKRQVLHTLGVVLTTAFFVRVVSEGTASEVQLLVAANARLTLRQILALPDLSKYIVACFSLQAELDCVIVRSTDGVYLGLFRNSSQETDLGADLSITGAPHIEESATGIEFVGNGARVFTDFGSKASATAYAATTTTRLATAHPQAPG